jgi:hypothetical protein
VGKRGMSIFLSDLLREQELDFVGPQETMKKDYSPSFFRKIDHMNCFEWRWIPFVGRSGGILGGFRSSRFNICNTSVGRFHIKVTLMDLKLQLKWNLIIFMEMWSGCFLDVLSHTPVACWIMLRMSFLTIFPQNGQNSSPRVRKRI